MVEYICSFRCAQLNLLHYFFFIIFWFSHVKEFVVNFSFYHGPKSSFAVFMLTSHGGHRQTNSHCTQLCQTISEVGINGFNVPRRKTKNNFINHTHEYNAISLACRSREFRFVVCFLSFLFLHFSYMYRFATETEIFCFILRLGRRESADADRVNDDEPDCAVMEFVIHFFIVRKAHIITR